MTHRTDKEIVVELLPRCLNAAGIMLALGVFQPWLKTRIEQLLTELEAEGRVTHDSEYVWHVVTRAA